MLRITTAQLKDGKTVPVKVTIVGVYAAGDEADRQLNVWSQKAGATEEENVFAGVDFHSDTASSDSGSFVSSGKVSSEAAEGQRAVTGDRSGAGRAGRPDRRRLMLIEAACTMGL